MNKSKQFLLLAALITTATVSCKKEQISSVPQDTKNEIIKINNNPSNDRVNLTDDGMELDFVQADADVNYPKSGANSTAANFPYKLKFKGRIGPQLDVNNNPLSSLEVSSYGSNFIIGYQTPGDKFAGGVDVISLNNNGNPHLETIASIPDADVTCVNSGNGHLYFGMDLRTYEHFDYPAPAVLGVVKFSGQSLSNPQTVGLEGYSTKDVKFNPNNNKIYTATSTQGGVSVIGLDNQGVASRLAYQSYGIARSIGISGTDLIITNGYSYAYFNPTTLAMSNYSWWPIQSGNEPIGRMETMSNGNLVFGNGYAFIYVNKYTGTLIDQVYIGGIVNGVSVVNDKIYISTGNSLIVAEIDHSNHIKLLAKTHFSSKFGGDFNVISSKVSGDKVIVACGVRGTYIFKLKQVAP
jgi:hypothetical protein